MLILIGVPFPSSANLSEARPPSAFAAHSAKGGVKGGVKGRECLQMRVRVAFGVWGSGGGQFGGWEWDCWVLLVAVVGVPCPVRERGREGSRISRLGRGRVEGRGRVRAKRIMQGSLTFEGVVSEWGADWCGGFVFEWTVSEWRKVIIREGIDGGKAICVSAALSSFSAPSASSLLSRPLLRQPKLASSPRSQQRQKSPPRLLTSAASFLFPRLLGAHFLPISSHTPPSSPTLPHN